MQYYTGIGSRETPYEVCVQMAKIASRLERQGFILRSGGAEGADEAFERGAGKQMEIYHPWKGFSNTNSRYVITPDCINAHVWDEAVDRVSRVHRAWDQCSQAARKLHTRNVFQVFGKDLAFGEASQFVICWAPPLKNGRVKGGTATAVELAIRAGIPVINLHV